MTNPIQPLVKDEHGVLRFKANKLVQHLLDWAQARGHGMNEMAGMDFPQEDWEQFAQLIGYSLSGFAELSYVRDTTYNAARGVSVGQGPRLLTDAEIVAIGKEAFGIDPAFDGHLMKFARAVLAAAGVDASERKSDG